MIFSNPDHWNVNCFCSMQAKAPSCPCYYVLKAACRHVWRINFVVMSWDEDTVLQCPQQFC